MGLLRFGGKTFSTVTLICSAFLPCFTEIDIRLKSGGGFKRVLPIRATPIDKLHIRRKIMKPIDSMAVSLSLRSRKNFLFSTVTLDISTNILLEALRVPFYWWGPEMDGLEVSKQILAGRGTT